MKVGTLAYATNQGLGILARAFYNHGIVTDFLIIRHGTHLTHEEWYPGAKQISSLRSQKKDMLDFCLSMNVMLFFETPFEWSLLANCQQAGVKTVLITMYECTPEHIPYYPDLFICPSLLDLKYFPKAKSVFLPIPVEVPWKLRTRAEVFVHNAGHGGLRGRNGTLELERAIPYVKSPAKFLIRAQSSMRTWRALESKPNVEYFLGTLPYEELYDKGDVFVFPEKFNGLSLPLQEAYASGMLVMGTDRFPVNTWLPKEPLIQPTGYQRAQIGPPYNVFDESIHDSRVIANKIDEWYNQDIFRYSVQGRDWSLEHSWEKLGPKYKEVLKNL